MTQHPHSRRGEKDYVPASPPKLRDQLEDYRARLERCEVELDFQMDLATEAAAVISLARKHLEHVSGDADVIQDLKDWERRNEVGPPPPEDTRGV